MGNGSKMVEKKQQTAYEIIGGEQAVKILVERFYYYMEALPEAADVRGMHAADLTAAKQKLFKFLSEWLGGPGLFIREYGHPRLRMRHFPFNYRESGKGSMVAVYDSGIK